MNQVKKVMVIMLPTENINKNGIQPFKKKNTLDLISPFTGAQARKLSYHPNIEAQHLYFVVNERMIEGDYIYSELSDSSTPEDCIQKNFIIEIDGKDVLYSDAQSCINYKIIASTNQMLNLPRPSKEFVSKYCEKNGNIKFVNVEYEENCHGVYLPKRAKDNTITIYPIKSLYNKDEVIELLSKILDERVSSLQDKKDFLSNFINKNL